MAMAARRTVAQVRSTVALGALDPERIVTPSIFVDQIVVVSEPVSERDHLQERQAAR
jgi:3-oxoadipate CoA-transferase alpha subunit